MIKIDEKCFSEDYQHWWAIFQRLQISVTELKKSIRKNILSWGSPSTSGWRVGNSCLNPIVNFYILSTCHWRSAVYAPMRQLIITSRHVATGVWDTKCYHKAETYLQHTLRPSNHYHDDSFWALKWTCPKTKTMDVRKCSSWVSDCAHFFFFVFPQDQPTRQLCHFLSFMLRCACPHYSFQLLTTDPDIYASPILAEQSKSRARRIDLKGKKRQRGEELRPARALLPSCAPQLARQRSRINPLPGTPARISGHNRMWQPAHEPVICMVAATALCKLRVIVTVWF